MADKPKRDNFVYYNILPMQPKICFVTTGDIRINATAKRALGMANPLCTLGWRVYILMEDTEENRHRAAIECCKEVTVIYFSPRSAIGEIRAKNSIIGRIAPNIIYISAPVVRNMVRVPHRCLRITEHSELMSHITSVRGLARIKAYAMEWLSILLSDAMVCASQYLIDIFAQRSQRCMRHIPTIHLPYAYNCKVCYMVPIDRSTIENGRYTNRKIFCYLGSVTHNYGAITMTHAIDHLRHSHPEALLIILGSGPAMNDVKQLINKFDLVNHIELKGFVCEEDISYYFSLADYFLSPMRDTDQDRARCPSKLYMYLPYNKPIITCRIGEPAATLGDKGTYYTPDDAKDMAQKMAQLIDSRKTQLDIDATRYTWQAITHTFDRWINNIVKLK